MCTECNKKGRHGSNPGSSKKISVFGPGHDVKVRYVGASKDLLDFDGPATRKIYTVGGRINLVVADSRDLSTGVSWAPGLLEMTDAQGHKLFEIHVPLKEEIEAKVRAQEAREAAEALAVKPKRRKAEEPDGEGTVSGD